MLTAVISIGLLARRSTTGADLSLRTAGSVTTWVENPPRIRKLDTGSCHVMSPGKKTAGRTPFYTSAFSKRSPPSASTPEGYRVAEFLSMVLEFKFYSTVAFTKDKSKMQ